MRNSNASDAPPPLNPHFNASVTIQDVDDVDGAVSDDGDPEVVVVEQKQASKTAAYQEASSYQTMSLVSYNHDPQSLANPFVQPKNKNDDTANAFGDPLIGSLGSYEYAPVEPSAPPMDAQMQKEYEQWLRASQLVERRQFENHKEWQESLENSCRENEFSPIISTSDIPEDKISHRFRELVVNEFDDGKMDDAQGQNVVDTFFRGVRPPQQLKSLPTYQSPHSEGPGKADDIVNLMKLTDEKEKASSMNPRAQTIPAGRFWVISDHNGGEAGKKFQVWGPGRRQPFSKLGRGNLLSRVDGTEDFPLNTDFAHVPGRFTIVRINPNEIGFCHHLKEQATYQLKPGRYFIKEVNYNYIGKATVVPGNNSGVQAHEEKPADFIAKRATQLSVVHVQPNQVAFVKGPKGTFLLEQRDEPYILDENNNIAFINIANKNARIAAAADHSYYMVNLQPSDYIVFRDAQGEGIVWTYSAENKALNHIHLPALFFHFDGRIHNVNQGSKAFDDYNLAVVYNRPSDFVILRDRDQQLRFLEEQTKDPLVLRRPWNYLETGVKAERNYEFKQDGPGRRVVRITPTKSESVMVLTQKGHTKFFPPLLSGKPYYFYEPEHQVMAVINKSKEGVQEYKVPGVGEVSVVNLTTGNVGACVKGNVFFLLNPRPMYPYVFVSPDKYLQTLPKDQSHVQSGDLHRVYLKPDERAVVVIDGRAVLLPDEGSHEAKENNQNGIYTFRARQKFEIHGPAKKTQRRYKLGPYEFFNVTVGEVAYGNKEGELCTWGQGEHSVNMSNNERVTDFFATNVDPLEIKDIEVNCKHSVKSHLDLYVTYSISDAEKTIKRFGSHDKLHGFMEEISRATILDLCAKKPPMGFSDADFDAQQEAKAKSHDDTEEATEMGEVGNDLLKALKSHQEVQESGIQVGFAQITRWTIDAKFMKQSQDIALKLQQAHADIENRRMEIERRRLEGIADLNKEDLEIEKQKRENQKAALAKQQQRDAERAEIEQKASLKLVEAQAQANAELAKQAATQKQREQKAQMDNQLAEIEAKRAEIENQTQLARTKQQLELQKVSAITDAEIKASAKTANSVAEAKAALQVSETRKAAADVELSTTKTQADATIALAEAEAQAIKIKGLADAHVQAAKCKAAFAGIDDPKLIAQIIMQREMLQAYAQLAATQKVVTHTINPDDADRMRQQQMQQMQMMMSTMPFAGSQGLPMTAGLPFFQMPALLNKASNAGPDIDEQKKKKVVNK